MQDVCTERSQSWGLKNLFLPVSPMRLLSHAPPPRSSLCISPASKTEQEHHIQQVSPPPADTNHAAWKDQGGEVCFSQETHCQEEFKQLLLGEKGGTLNKEISQRRGSGREEPGAQGDFCQRAILLIRITELLSLPDTSLQMVKHSLLALWKCLYHLVIQ